jgi:ABC-type amino acid transport substrate-binding protein
MKAFLGWVLFLATVTTLSAQRVIIFEKGTGEYEIEVLGLALRHTVSDFGAFQLKEWGQDVTEERAIAILNDGGFDITFMVITPERERRMLVIPVDLTRGVQGYRLLLVHKDNLEQFSRIKTLDQLTSLACGFGSQWSDLPILERNGFQVTTAPETAMLYRMLEHKRFDYFPRGINEIWDNVVQHHDDAPDMAIEPHLALYYPLVQCFVVARNNTELAARVRLGLDRALADGSLKELFLRWYGKVLQKARMSSRTLFVLKNQDLPSEGTPDTSWWLGK